MVDENNRRLLSRVNMTLLQIGTLRMLHTDHMGSTAAYMGSNFNFDSNFSAYVSNFSIHAFSLKNVHLCSILAHISIVSFNE